MIETEKTVDKSLKGRIVFPTKPGGVAVTVVSKPTIVVPAVKTENKPVRYFLKYTGAHQHLRITPHIGKVVPGKEYEVPKSLYDAMRREPNWIGHTSR